MPPAGKCAEYPTQRGAGDRPDDRPGHQTDARRHILPDELRHGRVETCQKVQRDRGRLKTCPSVS